MVTIDTHHLLYIAPVKNSNEDFLEPHFPLEYLVFETKEHVQFPQPSVKEIRKQMLWGWGDGSGRRSLQTMLMDSTSDQQIFVKYN